MKCDDSDWVERACPQAAPAEATANVSSILTTSASRPAICQTNICHLCLHCWRTPFPKKSLSQYGCFANPVALFFCVGVWFFCRLTRHMAGIRRPCVCLLSNSYLSSCRARQRTFQPTVVSEVGKVGIFFLLSFARPSQTLRSCKGHGVTKVSKPKWVRQNCT